MQRQLNEMACATGRKWQSAQTGFIHFCYHEPEEGIHHTIPTEENILFVLALLKSRVAENIHEAKKILDRWLCYQGIEGNFPIYFHDLPYCFNRWHGVKLLHPLFVILKHFHHILGQELKTRVQESAKQLMHYCLKTLEENTADYLTTLLIATAAKGFGEMFQDVHLTKEGEALLVLLAERGPHETWNHTESLGKIYVALQMIYPSISTGPWKPFWDYLNQTWNQVLRCYVGPSREEKQSGPEPKVNLYDYCMASLSQQLPNRCLITHPDLLHCVKILPTEDKLIPNTFSGTYQVVPVDRGFRLVWGTAARLHTFVCEGGCFKEIEVNQKEGTIDLLFTLDQPEDLTEKQEICFYSDVHPQAKWSVNGVTATVFKLGQEVCLESDLNFWLTFTLVEGTGQFLGHWVPGNRPSQVKKSLQMFDWYVFLRTIRRSNPCKIRVTLHIKD